MGERKGKPNIPWQRIVRQLRERPGTWRLFPEMVGTPFRTVDVVRKRQRPALRTEGGVVRARPRNKAWLDDGRIVCDLYLSFERSSA